MKTYSNNKMLNEMINKAVTLVERGEAENLEKMVKTEPTYILKASQNHPEKRYRPGNKLTTYTKIEDGRPKDETWGDGIVQENSVILTNKEPIKHNGEVVKGFYNEEGEFIIDKENGTEFLKNEYFSNVEWVLENYGIKATEKWQEGFK